MTKLIDVLAEHGFSAAGALLLYKVLGKPAGIASEMLSDEIYFWQWKRRLDILERAERILADRRVSIRELSPGFTIPFLEGAGNVDSAELQNLWAGLLAFAVEDDHAQHPMFIRILKDLNADEARLLFALATKGPLLLPTSAVLPHRPPDSGVLWHVANEPLGAAIKTDGSRSQFYVSHLGSLDLVERTGSLLMLAHMGRHFVEVCAPETDFWKGAPLQAGWSVRPD